MTTAELIAWLREHGLVLFLDSSNGRVIVTGYLNALGDLGWLEMARREPQIRAELEAERDSASSDALAEAAAIVAAAWGDDGGVA